MRSVRFDSGRLLSGLVIPRHHPRHPEATTLVIPSEVEGSRVRDIPPGSFDKLRMTRVVAQDGINGFGFSGPRASGLV
jgi:hypothetical protein